MADYANLSHLPAMARRSGSADLPLHSGRVPPWLATRMAALGAVICEAIVHHFGRDEFLRRLAHPFWFQSFGAVMGMDWHSSGITTSVIGALKREREVTSSAELQKRYRRRSLMRSKLTRNFLSATIWFGSPVVTPLTPSE